VNNPYKQRLGRPQLDLMLKQAGIDPGLLSSHVELTDGFFNTVHRIKLTDGTGLVVKVAPPPDVPLMAYEHGLVRNEEMFYQAAAAGGVPVPRVVFAGIRDGGAGSDFLLMEECPGTNWYAQRDRIAAESKKALRAELGGVVARLHRVEGKGFGYSQQVLLPDWRTAFLAMVGSVLDDAQKFGAALPMPVDEIRALVDGQAHLLDDTGAPVLVHFDLWAGNILVDFVDGVPRVSAIVDGERAFWGDPLADTASLALFGDIEDDQAFLEGYRSAGGVVVFDSSSRRRLALYRTYLYLIMLVETVPRGQNSPEDQRMSRHVGEHLLTSLRALAEDAVRGTDGAT